MKLIDIKGYEGLYKISQDGQVFSILRNKFRKLSSISNSGYLRIDLYINGKCKYHSIHRLVAKAFLENPNNYKTVNHKDGNKLNNNVSNLEWCSSKENSLHGRRILKKGLGMKHGMSKLKDSDIYKIRNLYDKKSNKNEIASKFNISVRMVYLIGARKNWSHLLN